VGTGKGFGSAIRRRENLKSEKRMSMPPPIEKRSASRNATVGLIDHDWILQARQM